MKRAVLILSVISIFLLGIGGWAWWTKVWQSPDRVFWAALSNNLSTSGVTRQLHVTSNGVDVMQYTQLSLANQPTVRSLTTLTQAGSSYVTEEISNQQSDLVRYRAINGTDTSTGKPLNTTGVVGQWVELSDQNDFSSLVSPKLFDQSILGILPIANLKPADRAMLLAKMKDDHVFTYDRSKVATVTNDGQRAYKYTVTIQPAAYVSLMQEFGSLVGAKEYVGLNPNDYNGTTAVRVNMYIGMANHELLEIDQTSTGHNELYRGFGIAPIVQVPKASLTTTELAKRISQLRS